jgi:carbon storage regulator
MLVLTRQTGEEIVIDGVIRVRVVSTQGNRVRLSIDAPRDVTIDRAEIHDRRKEFCDEPSEVATRVREVSHCR